MTRLGGEYHKERDRDYSRWAARVQFLRRIEALAPEVLKELRDDVLSVYIVAVAKTQPPLEKRQPLIKRLRGDVLPLGEKAPITTAPQAPAAIPPGDGQVTLSRDPDWIHCPWEALIASADPDVGNFTKALARWAEGYHLTDRWFLDGVVRRTLREWHRRPERTLLKNPPFFDVDAASLFKGFKFGHTPWVPTWATWKEYQADLQKAFAAALRKYRKRMEEWTTSMGYARTKAKRARQGDDPLLHFDWLVRFQVREWTHDRIAKHYKLSDTKTVASAIKKTADLIGLTRRRRAY